jgi:electron transport complex protein RnfD
MSDRDMTLSPEERLLLTASPHLKSPDSTPKIMWNVVGSLVPIVLVAVYYFGPSAILVMAAAILGALAVEYLFGPKRSLWDGSAAITGILLGLCLPAGFPLWMAFLGGAFGIGFGKLVFGGLGQNPFNPALVGRAFLQAAFPTAITTWPRPDLAWSAWRGPNFSFPLLTGEAPDGITLRTGEVADGITEATPLGAWKFDGELTETFGLVIGNTGGSLGETAGLLILLCGGYLAVRRYLNWRIPVGIFATVFVFSEILYLINGEAFPPPFFMLFSGGLMLGAMYMATDMVTSPVTNLGSWIFAVGIGLIVVLVRVWGGLPEGVMYAILIMNAFVPFIDRATQPKVFGHIPPEEKAEEATA